MLAWYRINFLRRFAEMHKQSEIYSQLFYLYIDYKNCMRTIKRTVPVPIYLQRKYMAHIWDIFFYIQDITDWAHQQQVERIYNIFFL